MVANIFKDIPDCTREEIFESIVSAHHIQIMRITSMGQRSPDDFWYDQDDNEWVIVLQGRACLKLKESAKHVVMEPGDHQLIPAHTNHRVEWTDPDEITIWLAIHYK